MELSLSSANPSIEISPPELETVNVRFYLPPQPVFLDECKMESASILSFAPVKRSMPSSSFSSSRSNESKARSQPMKILTSTVKSNSMGGTTYSIPRKASIFSGNSTHKVTIAIINLDCKLNRVLIPRKSPLLYSTNSINNSEFSLLAGQAKIYYGNSFVSSINLNCINLKKIWMFSRCWWRN